MINEIKRYGTFIKYTISAGIAFTIDLSFFTLFNRLLNGVMGSSSILISTLLARIISSFINYLINRNTVFGSNNKGKIDNNTLIKYYSLVVIQLCISALSVYIIHMFIKIDATIIKVPVDIIIFIINYFIQKHIIFKECKNEV
ncbi:MAG: GtrA family protein [Bacilli bacterium]